MDKSDTSTPNSNPDPTKWRDRGEEFIRGVMGDGPEVVFHTGLRLGAVLIPFGLFTNAITSVAALTSTVFVGLGTAMVSAFFDDGKKVEKPRPIANKLGKAYLPAVALGTACLLTFNSTFAIKPSKDNPAHQNPQAAFNPATQIKSDADLTKGVAQQPKLLPLAKP
jgi:hypothetical protein